MLVIKNLPSCPWREQTLLSWLSHSDFPRWWLTLCSALPVLPAGTSADSSKWGSHRSRQLPQEGSQKYVGVRGGERGKAGGRFVLDPCFPVLDSEVSTEAPSSYLNQVLRFEKGKSKNLVLALGWNWDQTTRA